MNRKHHSITASISSQTIGTPMLIMAFLSAQLPHCPCGILGFIKALSQTSNKSSKEQHTIKNKLPRPSPDKGKEHEPLHELSQLTSQGLISIRLPKRIRVIRNALFE